MKKIHWLLLLGFLVAALSSCEESSDPLALTAPEIPPVDLFAMPADAVSSIQADTTANTQATYRNWAYAGINLLVWHTIAVVHTAIPVAAFDAALNENPVYIGNHTFEWSYQYLAPPALGGKTYDVVLTGQYLKAGQEVEWIMNLSEVGGFTNFEWYRGRVATDFSEGEFTVRRYPNNPEPYLHIEYEGRASNTSRSLRYTHVSPTSAEQGGYIEYRVLPNAPFNRAFEALVDPAHPNNFLEVEWTEPSGEGRVKNPAHFQDSDWHCWDSQLRDSDC